MFDKNTRSIQWELGEVIKTTYRNQVWKYKGEELNIDPPEFALERIKQIYASNYEGELPDSKVIDAIVSCFEIYVTQLRESSFRSIKEYGR